MQRGDSNSLSSPGGRRGPGRGGPLPLKLPHSLLILVLSVLVGGPCITHGAERPQQFQFDDFLLAPLRVHLLSASNAPNLHTTLKAKFN